MPGGLGAKAESEGISATNDPDSTVPSNPERLLVMASADSW